MKLKILMCLTTLGLLLSSCGETGISNSSNNDNYSITPIEPEQLIVNDIYSAVNKLVTMRNYTLSVTMTVDNESFAFDNIYAEKYYYCNYLGDEEGFIEDSNGVYRVNYYKNQLISSELYTDENGNKYTSLWDSGVIKTFSSLDSGSYNNAINQKKFNIPTKKDKLLVMEILELDTLYYPNLAEAYFTIQGGDTLNNLYLILSFDNGSIFNCVFNQFGKSESSEILDFKAQNKTYTEVSEDLKRVKSLFALDNYKRVCYENEDPNQRVIGYEWFTENYWFGDYIVDEYALYEQGFLGLEKKVLNGKEYDGAYLFYLSDDYSNYTFYDYAPAFTTNISSMRDIMNYPSKLAMFNYNLQFFEKIEDEANVGKNVYATTDLYIIQDWLENFQIQLNTDTGEQAYVYDLRIITDLYSKDSDCVVTFQFDYVIGDVVYGLQREFIDFGVTRIDIIEEFYNQFEDQ